VYGTILGDAFDAAAVVAGLDEGFRIERSYVKLHACCLFNHPALDAVHALCATERLTPDAITRIEVTSVPFVTRMADPAPATMLSAKFSVPWAVAAAVVLGRSDVEAFTPSALADARVRDLATRVVVQGRDDMSLRRDGTTAIVRVTLRDGRVLTGDTAAVRGDAANPVGWDVVTDKFYRLAAPALG
jgi:2-methylcitrate dehydratase PrpD